MLLGDAKLFANVAVKDAAAAKEFYGGKLGLELIDENDAVLTYKSAEGKIFVYMSGTAGSGQATCATWEVEDATATAKELADKGIVFEHYDMPGMTREGDIHKMGGESAAWFKDPDGNILAVVSGEM
jgi:catechol 2,3-dioxygenase-like lactoylglutathione lyase family enzyme